MPSRLRTLFAAQLTTVIARMLGKAVKLRHCPATVSAPACVTVHSVMSLRQEFGQGSFAPSRLTPETTEE